MKNNLQKLEEILKKCIDMGWTISWNGDVDEKNMLLKCRCTEYWLDDGCFSMWYDQLFSAEVWLLQFVKWKIKKHYYTRTTTMAGMTLRSAWEDTMREYHAMQMSILPVEEKIEYFISNIDIHENN